MAEYELTKGDDSILGTDGDDVIVVKSDTAGPMDRIDGGAGHDVLRYDGLFAEDMSLRGATVSNVEEIVLLEGNSIQATTLNNFQIVSFEASREDDPNVVRLGGESLLTPKSWVTIDGAETVRILTSTYTLNVDQHGVAQKFEMRALLSSGGSSNLTGGTLDDQLFGGMGSDMFEGGQGADLLSGLGGRDTASYLRAEQSVLVNMLDMTQNTGEAHGDQFVLIEDLIGSHHNDTIVGNDTSNRLNGAHGDDVIKGNAGNDLIKGSNGNDDLDGGNGNDYLQGGNDNDVLHGSAGNDTLQGDSGSNTIDGGDGVDTISYLRVQTGFTFDLADSSRNSGQAALDTYTNVENVKGGLGWDTIFGDANDNYLDGSRGNDTLYGGDGRDTLAGGSGADWLYGGNGTDIYYGGASADHFVFEGGDFLDELMDFQDGIDKIVITAGDQRFEDLEMVVFGNDVQLDYGHGSIYIHNVTLAQLDASDFIFQSGA